MAFYMKEHTIIEQLLHGKSQFCYSTMCITPQYHLNRHQAPTVPSNVQNELAIASRTEVGCNRHRSRGGGATYWRKTVLLLLALQLLITVIGGASSCCYVGILSLSNWICLGHTYFGSRLTILRSVSDKLASLDLGKGPQCKRLLQKNKNKKPLHSHWIKTLNVTSILLQCA